jgi:hypothetical protein
MSTSVSGSDLLLSMILRAMVESSDNNGSSSKKKKFDGTPETVTKEMRDACPLTKKVTRVTETEYELLPLFGPTALGVFGSKAKVEHRIERALLLHGSAKLTGVDGVYFVFRFTKQRIDSEEPMSAYQLMEAEDVFASGFTRQCISLFITPAWAKVVTMCRLIMVETEFGKCTVSAKIKNGRPTVRIIRAELTSAIAALCSELTTLEQLDDAMIESMKSAARPLDIRVAAFETERRAAAEAAKAAEIAKAAEKAARVSMESVPMEEK